MARNKPKLTDFKMVHLNFCTVKRRITQSPGVTLKGGGGGGDPRTCPSPNSTYSRCKTCKLVGLGDKLCDLTNIMPI